jgi:hypothetical protein
MRREDTETVRKASAARAPAAKRAKRADTTKQAHERLLRGLADRRLKRLFGS